MLKKTLLATMAISASLLAIAAVRPTLAQSPSEATASAPAAAPSARNSAPGQAKGQRDHDDSED